MIHYTPKHDHLSADKLHPAWQTPDGTTPFSVGKEFVLLANIFEEWKGKEDPILPCRHCGKDNPQVFGLVGDKVHIERVDGTPWVKGTADGPEFEVYYEELMPLAEAPQYRSPPLFPAPKVGRTIALPFDMKQVENQAGVEGRVWGLHFATGAQLLAAWKNFVNAEYSLGPWLSIASVRDVVDRCIHSHHTVLALRTQNEELHSAWRRGFGSCVAAVLGHVMRQGEICEGKHQSPRPAFTSVPLPPRAAPETREEGNGSNHA